MEAKIDDEYTWKQFFQENFSVERNQLSEPLCFMTLMKDADKENHQDNWIIIRVHKAHWGRSPIFNWRGLVLATQGFKISKEANWKVILEGYSDFTQF